MAESSALLKQGVVLTGEEYNMRPDYLYTNLNTIKPEMIREATQNARKAAEQFARDSGSSVGNIIKARQGLFSITNRDRNSPHKKIIRVVTTVDYMLTNP